jgi:formamidopyrimidine-DNA glycosylase
MGLVLAWALLVPGDDTARTVCVRLDWSMPAGGQNPGRAVGEALLDQRNLAGIGNVYKCEVLFLSGISPWRPVGEISNLGALARLSRRLLDANKNRHGHITTGNLRRGATHYVYGRRGMPCRRCGTLIRYHNGQGGGLQERITYWCPPCQTR